MTSPALGPPQGVNNAQHQADFAWLKGRNQAKPHGKYHDSPCWYFPLLQRYSSSTMRRLMLQALEPRDPAGTRRWDGPRSPAWLGHRNEIIHVPSTEKVTGRNANGAEGFAAGQAGRADPHNPDPGSNGNEGWEWEMRAGSLEIRAGSLETQSGSGKGEPPSPAVTPQLCPHRGGAAVG